MTMIFDTESIKDNKNQSHVAVLKARKIRVRVWRKCNENIKSGRKGEKYMKHLRFLSRLWRGEGRCENNLVLSVARDIFLFPGR